MDINQHWYQRSMTVVCWALLPLSFAFRGIVALRRYLYQKGILKSHRIPVPVIVVGNIAVGGTGKTPTVIWLAKMLKQQGYKPGIVTRGYGGKGATHSIFVSEQSDYWKVGDEALLITRNSHCPVVVNKDRVAGAQDLFAQRGCNVIISDDGLQHYRMARAIEIAVIDNTRRFGNGKLLPAGPLREPISRLKNVDLILSHPYSEEDEYAITYLSTCFRSLNNEKITVGLDYFAHQKVHALAGIGHPERFFHKLRSLQIDVIEHVFPDHHPFVSSDIFFHDGLPVLMTEKDAVKCWKFASDKHWYLPIDLEVEQEVKEKILQKLGEGV